MITKKKKAKELGLKSYCNKDVDSFTLLLEVRKEKHEGSRIQTNPQIKVKTTSKSTISKKCKPKCQTL